jgi:hypothetical protein
LIGRQNQKSDHWINTDDTDPAKAKKPMEKARQMGKSE